MTRLLLALLAAPLLAGAASARAEDPELVRHVVSRLTYGPRQDDLDRVGRIGVTAFIAEQLAADLPEDPELATRLAHIDAVRLSVGELARAYPQLKQRKAAGMTMEAGVGKPARPQARDDAAPRRILDQLAGAKLLRAVYARNQLKEVMIDFWFNHFNVFWSKDDCKWLVPGFERDAIRPNALGSFRELLGAVAHHPAMLFYLDNRLSSAPMTGGNGKTRGLNENYARELLELHTMGVEGGYTQQDVIEVARCFTGWTIERKDSAQRFLFRPKWHDAGDKTVLGRLIRGTKTAADGEQVLDLLACHPATARFIALKLCRRFIADDPPATAVAAVAAAFTRSDGDIRETLGALLACPEFTAPESRRAKIKTPVEYLTSAIRILGADTEAPRPLLDVLRRMGQMPYLCEPPTGFPDVAAPWASAGALLERLRVAESLARGKTPSTRVDLERAAGCPLDGDLFAATDRLWERLVGAPMSAETRRVLEPALSDAQVRRAALDDLPGPPDYPRVVAMILGSPEFQRR